MSDYFFLNGKILVYKIYVVKFVGILNPNTILAPNVLNSQGVSFFYLLSQSYYYIYYNNLYIVVTINVIGITSTI